MTIDTDILRRSVTRGDYSDDPYSGPLSIFVGPALAPGGLLSNAPGLPGTPGYRRDAVLSSTLNIEDMWASAVYKAISKQASLGFNVNDTADSERRVNHAQELMVNADGLAGWVRFLNRHLQDFLLTDNGAFIEVIRASSGAGSRILGLAHLDSFRCLRTADPEIPVLYRGLDGKEHELKAHQVLMFADMASPRVELRGMGRCAASRAFQTILKLTAVEVYFREKVSGARNLAIHIVRGINERQLSDALLTANADADRKGYVVYRGSTIIPVVQMDQEPVIATIPLAEIPDGFDVEVERRDAYLRYANALGVPVQDIQPLSGQGLGTGTQSVILAEAAEGAGLAAWRAAFELAMTHAVLPAATTFSFATNDIRSKRDEAEVLGMQVTAVTTLVEKGVLDGQRALNMLVDMGAIPKEFLPQDATPGGMLSSNEKPAEGEPATPPVMLPPLPVAPPAQPVTKARKAVELDERVIEEARKLREEVRG